MKYSQTTGKKDESFQNSGWFYKMPHDGSF
jgi:hypothetical protein